MSPERPARRSSLTAHGWILVVVGVMGTIGLLGAIIGGYSLIRTDQVVDDLLIRIHSARVAGANLQSALTSQEAAVRSYLLTSDKQFLETYRTSRAAESEASAEIRSLTTGAIREDADEIDRLTRNWHVDFAEPATTSLPESPAARSAAAAESSRAFSPIRTQIDEITTSLAAARKAALSELDRVQSWRNGMLIGIVLVFGATAVSLVLLARSAVTRPLERLAAACRRTTEDRLDEPIEVNGPKDICAIAADVESMRKRILDSRDSWKASSEQLSRQTSALNVQTHELRRSNAELEQFAYVASHDLQEPLRKVASFCQLLQKRYSDQLDDRGIQYIEFAVDGAKRMQTLINDLLVFSRVGRAANRTSPVALDDVLDRGLENLATAIGETDAVITRPPEGLPRILGDATLLVMLWQNLVGNSIKFRRPEVAPRIDISYRSGTEADADSWIIEVADNGIGIADEFSEKVFIIFQRLHGRDAYSGTGIGLALCRKIVEEHGGRIWIDNTYSGGTRICMTFAKELPSPLSAERKELSV